MFTIFVSGMKNKKIKNCFIVLRFSNGTITACQLIQKKNICLKALLALITVVGFFGSFWKTHTLDYFLLPGSLFIEYHNPKIWYKLYVLEILKK